MLSTRSGVEPIDASEVASLISLYKYDVYAQTAIATILCYDTITTFDKEVKYFWSSPCKVASIVYFLNRYVGIFAVIVDLIGFSFHTNAQLCNFSTWAGNMADWMTIVLIDYILLMRVLAFFSEARVLPVCLKTLFVSESAFMLGILIKMTINEKISVGGAEGFVFCGNDNGISPVLETLYWVAPFSFEFVLMCLALYKATEFWRDSAGFDGFTLAKVLIQDQVIYFVLIMVCSAAHITVFWVDQRGSPSIAINIFEYILASTTLPCIVGSRLLVHLNEAAEKGVNGGTSYRLDDNISDIQFV